MDPLVRDQRKPGVKNPLHAILLAAALLLLAEEWLWQHLKTLAFGLRQYRTVRRFEARMRQLPPSAAIVVLAAPAAVIFPFKLVAVWAMVHGHPVLGLATLIAAKVTGTAAAAYLFDLVKDSARRLGWFDAMCRRITGLLMACRVWVHEQPAYVAAVALAAAARSAARRFLLMDAKAARKFRAAKTVSRRWKCCLQVRPPAG